MNALQRLELLSEHAELVQVIPTLKAMAKLDSLERLSEIVALLSGEQSSFTPEQNIENGKKAMQKVIAEHKDVKHAMYRNDIGWIDFVWGEIGEVKPNGKSKGGNGISHIIEARMRKDGMNEIQAQDFVNNAIVNALALGKSEVTSKKDTSTKTMVSYNGTIVHLVKNESENAWVLTGYEEYQKVEQVGGATNSDLRTNSPILSRTDVGASDNNTILQSNGDVNNGALSQVNSDKPQEIDVSAIDTDLSSYLAKHDNLQSATHEFFKDHLKGKVIKTVIGDVHILGSSWKHKLKQGIHKDELKAKAIPFIPQILSQGKYEQDRDKYKERTDVYVAFHAFFKEVQIDDELVGVRLLVGERENNEYEFVVYNAYPNAQMDALKNPNLSDTGNARAVLGFDNIVLDEADDVNDEYDDVEFDDSTASLFDGLMFDDIEDDADGWNIQIISITPIQSKEKSLFGKTKPVNRLKMIDTTFVYADDNSMWSNGHILVKEPVSDELVKQVKGQRKTYNFKSLPVNNMQQLVPAKNTQFKLADLATTTNGKKTQLAVLQDEQGDELAVNKSYLQFFIKEFGNDLEYWTNGLDASPVAIYKGGELVGLIMPMQNTQYEKHSEQEPKQDKPVIKEIANPYDESSVQENTMNESNYTQSDNESQILKAELLKLGLSQNGNDFTQSYLRGKYNETNVKLMFGNHALKFEIVQYDKNSRAYPIDDIIDFKKLNANDVITTIKRYIKGYKANGAITKYNSVNMQDVDMLTQLKYQFEQLGFDYVILHDGGRLGLYLTMKKSDIDVKITLKDEDVEVTTFNQFVDEKETFATTDIQGIVDFIQDMAEASKEYQAERDAKQAFSDDNDKLYEYLDKGWFGDGDKKELQPILDKYRHDPRLSEQVAQWEQQHQNWLYENEMETDNTNPNYSQSDIDYLQSIINGTLDLETVDMDKMIEIGEKDENDPMYEQALQVVSDYLDKLTSV